MRGKGREEEETMANGGVRSEALYSGVSHAVRRVETAQGRVTEGHCFFSVDPLLEKWQTPLSSDPFFFPLLSPAYRGR